MNSLIMYQLEGVKDDNAVSKLFSKYCPKGVDKFAGGVFLPVDSAPDFCKLVGLYLTQDTSKLEQIADLLTQENYDAKLVKFNQKQDKIHSGLVSATKKAAKSKNTQVELGGFNSGQILSEILSKTEQQQEQIDSNSRVMKAQGKLDKHLDKNQMIHESTQYTTVEKSAGGLLSFGAGMQSKERNIYDAINEAKKPTTDFVESSMVELKEFLEELLKVTTKVGLMPITDGNKTTTANTKRAVRLDQLIPNDLLKAQNREILYITK